MSSHYLNFSEELLHLDAAFRGKVRHNSPVLTAQQNIEGTVWIDLFDLPVEGTQSFLSCFIKLK